MSHSRFLPLREVRAAGWLADFLARQAAGLTGHPEASGHPHGQRFWGATDTPANDAPLAWWPFEQTGYWIDGALRCGYLTGDQALHARALAEIDYTLDHAAPDGFIGPQSLREQDRWPHAVFFRAVLAQYGISGDRRYLDALVRHYRATAHPMGTDRDVTGVEILLELYDQTGEPDLLETAVELYDRFNAAFPEHDCALAVLGSPRPPGEHGVTFNELAKLPAMLHTATGRPEYLEAAVRGYAKLAKQAELADGLHSASEHIRGRTARDTHETCDVTDHAWALAHLAVATGDARYGDTIEQVTFNALPGSVSKDFRALQYFSGPNQVVATTSSNHNKFQRGRNWMSYRPDHEVACCPGNVHRALPNYVSRMWLRSADGGLVAALYGPGQVRTTVGGATPVTITADTSYPYEQEIRFTVEPEQPVAFRFQLRIPGWCHHASVTVNGEPAGAQTEPGTWASLERTWRAGDVVRLQLPFELSLHHWPDEGISLTYGPLTLALPVPTRAEVIGPDRTLAAGTFAPGSEDTPSQAGFPAWNLYPAGPWNYALHVDETNLGDLAVEWADSCPDPLDPGHPALKLRVPASRVRNWRIIHVRSVRDWGQWQVDGKLRHGWRTLPGDYLFTPGLPKQPRLAANREFVELIPYAATMLRVTVFPQAQATTPSGAI